MSRYATWIEPTLINEWINLMQGYEGDYKRPYDKNMALLQWLNPEHDTRLVRKIALDIRSQKQPLYCIWSGSRLKSEFAIDHCLPFSAWPCNDLWNLFPSNKRHNLKKSDRLPSIKALLNSRERIPDWWHTAFLSDNMVREQFLDEATAALPGALIKSSDAAEKDIFDGLMLQRATLKRDQQLTE